jgi:perosamine synthetase
MDERPRSKSARSIGMDRKWEVARQIRQYGAKEKAYLAEVIDRAALSHFDNEGGFLQRFQEAFAARVGVKTAIPRANAMVALAEAVSVSGASTTDEVLCDSIVQFGALAAAYFNAVPRFVDVERNSYNMDPASLEANITERSKAVIVTHMWGLMADMDRIKKICDAHHLFLIEDCAHAIGSSWNGRQAGSFGDLGVFSFQEFKQLSTGDGGMLVTNNEDLAWIIRNKLAFSGESPKFMTMNFRMNETTAAVGLAQLEKIDYVLEHYSRTLGILNDAIGGCQWLKPRAVPPKAGQAGYWFACTWEGDKHGLDYRILQRLNEEMGIGLRFGFNQEPPYQFDLFRNAKLYGHPDCPIRCPLYTAKSPYRYQRGLCPTVEDLMPRLITVNLIFMSMEDAERTANRLQKAICIMDKG